MIINSVNSNYFPNLNLNNLKKSNDVDKSLPVNFGLNNPKAAMNRALQLKADYKDYNINYLLPNEIWSNAKIEKVVDQVDNDIKKMIKNGFLTIEKIQKSINKILPANHKNNIIVKDISELPKYLKYDGCDEEQIQSFMENCEGMQLSNSQKKNSKRLIFLPVADVLSEDSDTLDKLIFRDTLSHELTHALDSKFQNIDKSTTYHEILLGDNNYNPDFFNSFEFIFYPKIEKLSNFNKIESINHEKLLKCLRYKSEDKLFDDFSKAIKKIIKKDYSDVNTNIYESKQFYKYCQSRAHDEKKAYAKSKILREYENPVEKPVKSELASLLYEKMEKYFSNMAKNSKNFPEADI